MKHRYPILGLCLAQFFAGAAAAQKPRLLDTDTFFDMETAASPTISPDGSAIVFSRTWTDTQKDQDRSNLWIVDREGGRLRELTNGSWRDSSPVW
ncbi:MAG: TolB family protein, partial [bacterium]